MRGSSTQVSARTRRGQSLVELVLILPLLMLIFAGTTEIGFLLNERINQNRFTVAAARYGASLHYVQNADVLILAKALADASSIDTGRLLFVSRSGTRYGPFRLGATGGVETLSGASVTGFPENLFFRDDGGTASDHTDDRSCSPTSWRASYVEIQTIYPHPLVVPLAETFGLGAVEMQTTSVFPVVRGSLASDPAKRFTGVAPVAVYGENWQYGQSVVLKGDKVGQGSFGWIDLDAGNTLGLSKPDSLAGWLTGTVPVPDPVIPPAPVNFFTGQVNAANVAAAAASIVDTDIAVPFHDGANFAGAAVFHVTSFDVDTKSLSGYFVRYL